MRPRAARPLRALALLLGALFAAPLAAQPAPETTVAPETTAVAPVPEGPAFSAAPAADSAAVAVPEAGGSNRGWVAVLPPLIAIVLALAFRQVVVSLFAGVWVGAWIVDGTVFGFWTGLLRAFDTYVLEAVADADHAAIILFSLMIGGVVGIIQKNGGTAGIVDIVTRWARSARRGQIATALLGIAIFFDDYANTLIVGGTMRPITDRLRISREKLAFLVDATAAPVACIALVTTWIGYEVGLIGEAVANLPGYDEAAYSVFLNSLPYSFYPLLMIVFVLGVTILRRDFGPMLRAERRARVEGHLYAPGSTIARAEGEASALEPPAGKPRRALNAALPIAVLVVGVLGGLYVTGRAAVLEAGGEMSLREIVANASSYKAMLWGSLLAAAVAIALTVGQRLLSLEETLEAWVAGMRAMLVAFIILVLAWALSGVNDALGTADFLVSRLSGTLAPEWLPALVFVLAAATAFATGTSWGTMGILMPLVIPLAWGVLDASGVHTFEEHAHIVYSTVAVVLAGAVWGDHCSPISDTTILSSLASGCDHIDHVRTQLPYALMVGLVALLLGTIPTAYYVPWWVSLPVGSAVVIGLLLVFGRPVDEEPVPADAAA